MSERTTFSKNALILVRLILTALIVAYVYRRVDWASLFGILRLTDPVKLSVAVFFQGCAIAVATTRWRMLLANQNIRLSWPRTARLSLIGLFFNLFLLGSIGGDAAKFIRALPHAAQRRTRLALSLIQDRLIGLGGLLLLLIGFIALNHRLLLSDLTTRSLTFAILGAGAALVIVILMLWRLHEPPLPDSQERSWHWQNLDLKALGQSFPRPVFLPALGLSLLIHTLVIMAGYLAAHAVGVSVSFPEAGFVLGVTALALSLPITVAGLGVRDGMLVWLLAKFGHTTPGLAVSLSSCLLGIALFWALIGGISFYWPHPVKDKIT